VPDNLGLITAADTDQYHDQLPNWMNRQWTNASLIQAMTNHITTVMRRYRGKCTHWDVVNEGMFPTERCKSGRLTRRSP
jgi:GH35 family endo-1,4-beta-xylanase